MAQKIITVVLVLIVIGGLAWYFNKNYIQPSSSNETATLPQYKSSVTNEKFKGELVFVIKNAANEIWEVDSNKQSKKLFTDADETEKIIKISNLASTTREVLAITSSNDSSLSGKLVSINLTKAKENILQQNFVVPTTWALSSDGKKIAFVKFSNTEENYGFTLYSEDRDGTNMRALAREDSEIKLIAWDEANSNVSYVTTNQTKSEIKIVNIDTTKIANSKSFDNKIIDWISWFNNQLVLSIRDLESTSQGIIEILDPKSGNIQKLSDYNGGIANFVYVTDSNWFAYVLVQYKNKVNDSTVGQIYIENLSGEKIPIQKGNQILGWLPES